MKTRHIAFLGSVALGVLAAFLYASPYWTLHQLKVAAQETNASDLSKYIDYPALRDSVKSQMRAVMNKRVGSALLATGDSKDGDAVSALGASMGAVFASAMLDQVVDALVTPDAIAAVMTKGNAQADGDAVAGDRDTSEVSVALAYKGWDTVVATVTNPEEGPESVDLHLRRAGLISWKLVGVTLPL